VNPLQLNSSFVPGQYEEDRITDFASLAPLADDKLELKTFGVCDGKLLSALVRACECGRAALAEIKQARDSLLDVPIE
jgi:hypothetical protein